MTAYEAAIRDTIGLRQQPKMPRHVALDVAACTANHRTSAVLLNWLVMRLTVR